MIFIHSITICPKCFTQVSSNICSSCGYDSSSSVLNFLLPPGTLLCDKYHVGIAQEISALTITYIALDTVTGRIVYIDEFFPMDIAFRSGINVSHSDRHNITYKTMLSDLYERWTRLSALNSVCLPNIYDVLSMGGTAYCIYEYHHKKTLDDVINQAGKLQWSSIKNSFMPLFSLVSKLNSMGLSHCGISPSNIWVLPDGTFLLKGFSLPEVRTSSNMLKTELFSGYSAPEQYHKNMWMGEWTDVYSLGAVLYYTLSGIPPVNSDKRLSGESLTELSALVPDLPKAICNAVNIAMSPSIKERFSTVDAFSGALLREAASSTVVFSVSEQSIPKSTKSTLTLKSIITNLKPYYTLCFTIISIIAVLSIIANVVLGIGLSSELSENSNISSESSMPVSVTPMKNLGISFVGVHTSVINSMVTNGLKVNYIYDYSETLPENIVISQSIQPNEPIPENNTITLTVSKGSVFVKMPFLIGCTRDFAGQHLTNLGVKYRFETTTGLENNYPSGTVIATSKGYGERFNKNTETITITIKQ